MKFHLIAATLFLSLCSEFALAAQIRSPPTVNGVCQLGWLRQAETGRAVQPQIIYKVLA